MDVEKVLRCARGLLADPAAFWYRAHPEHRPRVQRAIYPGGLCFDGRLIGTAETSGVFSYSREIQARKEGMASPTGFEPVSPP